MNFFMSVLAVKSAVVNIARGLVLMKNKYCCSHMECHNKGMRMCFGVTKLLVLLNDRFNMKSAFSAYIAIDNAFIRGYDKNEK